jgi:hypothetical protein
VALIDVSLLAFHRLADPIGFVLALAVVGLILPSDSPSQLALYAVSVRGHDEVVQMLIDAGAVEREHSIEDSESDLSGDTQFIGEGLRILRCWSQLR